MTYIESLIGTLSYIEDEENQGLRLLDTINGILIRTNNEMLTKEQYLSLLKELNKEIK